MTAAPWHELAADPEHIRRARRLARAYTRRFPHLADEAESVAYLTLCEVARSHDPARHRSFAGRLAAALRCDVYDLLNAPRRARPVWPSDPTPPPRAAAPDAAPLDDLIDGALTPDQGECIRRHFGLAGRPSQPYSEIARDLGRSRRWAASHCEYGLARLRRALGVGPAPPRAANPGGLIGVHRERGRWAAKVYAGGRQVRVGTFATPEEAGRAYDLAALRLRGPDVRLNFPDLAPRAP